MPLRAARSRGFTLVEVLMAMGILATVVMGMAAFSSKHLSSTTRDRTKIQAAAAVEAQIALIRMDPAYAELRNRYEGTVGNTPFPGWSRQTLVVRTGTGTTADITRVTVTVTGPGLTTPITRSLTVAAP